MRHQPQYRTPIRSTLSILLKKKPATRKGRPQAHSFLPTKRPMTRKSLHQVRSLLPTTRPKTRRKSLHQARSLLFTKKPIARKNLFIARSLLRTNKSGAPPLRDLRLRNKRPDAFERIGDVMKKGDKRGADLKMNGDCRGSDWNMNASSRHEGKQKKQQQPLAPKARGRNVRRMGGNLPNGSLAAKRHYGSGSSNNHLWKKSVKAECREDAEGGSPTVAIKMDDDQKVHNDDDAETVGASGPRVLEHDTGATCLAITDDEHFESHLIMMAHSASTMSLAPPSPPITPRDPSDSASHSGLRYCYYPKDDVTRQCQYWCQCGLVREDLPNRKRTDSPRRNRRPLPAISRAIRGPCQHRRRRLGHYSPSEDRVLYPEQRRIYH
ncbi:hypothetical protein F5888DRAFT_882735 [Russula emetica]|nr:hypothetical protein F5888DRAFT_882735 [Russula emetica]